MPGALSSYGHAGGAPAIAEGGKEGARLSKTRKGYVVICVEHGRSRRPVSSRKQGRVSFRHLGQQSACMSTGLEAAWMLPGMRQP
eukprot:358582-Chlamydomonas_euryale.AAC.17